MESTSIILITSVILIILLLIYESIHQIIRQRDRKQYYQMAVCRANETGLPLIVIGDPANGFGSKLFGKTYGYGDYCIDLTGCPYNDNINGTNIKGDALKALKEFDNGSAVIFVSGVLEYVDDVDNLILELKRVGGEHLFIRIVSQYSLVSRTYGKIFPTFGDSSSSKNVFIMAPPIGDFKYFTI